MSSRRPSPARETMTRPSTSSRGGPASGATPHSGVSSVGAGAAAATPRRACSGPPDPLSGCGRERNADSFHRSPSPASTSNSASVRSPWPGYSERSRRAMSIWRRRLAASRNTPRSGLTPGSGISAGAWGCNKRLSPALARYTEAIPPRLPSPMPLRLSEHPQQDRPRERFWAVGAAALTGQELLAILIGTGCAGRDALTVAGEVLGRVDGSLRRLAGRPSAELARVPGIGRGQAARVAAALELGRRLLAEEEAPPERIRVPADLQQLYASRLLFFLMEEFPPQVFAIPRQEPVQI